MYKRFKRTLKYISLVSILCTCMTACGNADSQSAAEQSETEIIQESSEEIPIPSPELTSESEPESTPEPEPAQEPEEVIDNTQANTEKFYQTAEEDYGLSHEEAQNWFEIITKDGIFDGGVREISGLRFEDIDGNAEIAFATQGTGVGAVGDWYKAVFSYTGSTMERLEIPSDLDADYEEGINVEVIMEPEPDTYTAYCPYFDESITFQAPNIYEGDEQKEHLAQAPKKVGGNIRGYCGLQIVTWEGRNALQAIEYLSGEGGTGHFVGWACFILVWDEQGNGSVADWWVEGRTS